MVLCPPVCGAYNPEGSAFCVVCGSKLQSSGVPGSVLKKYDIYVNKGNIEFRNEEKVPELTVRKSGLINKEHLITESGLVIGKINGNRVYDGSGSTLLAVIGNPNVKPTQDKLRNYINSTMAPGTGVPVVRSYWIEEPSGNVLAKTVSENAGGNFLNSIPYLTYYIVDEKDTIARVEPRTSMINVSFLHLRYHLYLYSNKLQPVILAALIYAIKRGDDTVQWSFIGSGGGGVP